MRKRSFSKILVVILAVALLSAAVVGLAACGAKSGGDVKPVSDKTQLTASGYFDALWKSAKQIGSTAITPTDDLKFDFEMGIQLGILNISNDNLESVDIGLKVSLILDRKVAAAPSVTSDEGGVTAAEGEVPVYTDGTKTAAKIQLFDKSAGAANGNILTVYYFFDDPDFAYIDFRGQQVKFAFDTGLNNSDALNGLLAKLPGANSILKSSIDAALNSIVYGTGESWTLDAAVNALVGLVFDVESIDALLDTPMVQSALGLLKITKEDIISDGRLTIGKLLSQTSAAGMIFDDTLGDNNDADTAKTFTKKTEGGGLYYETQVNSGIMSLISGSLPDELKTILGGKITAAFETDTEGDLDNFAISIALDKEANASTNYKCLFAKVEISEIGIGKVENIDSMNQDTVLGINKADFKDTFDLGLEIGLDVAGLNLNLSETQNIALEGNYSLKINANLDLASVTDNKSIIYGALVKKGAAAADDQIIAELQYKDNKLIFKVDNSVKGGNVSYTKAVFELAGKPIIDALAKSEDVSMKMMAGLVAQKLFNATTEKPADAEIANYKQVSVPNPAVAGETVTYYYKLEYNTSFEGMVIENLNFVAIFQNWIKSLTDPKDDPVTPDKPVEDPTVFNGVYSNGLEGDKLRYYKSSDNKRPIAFSFNYVLKNFSKLIKFENGSISIGSNINTLILNVITTGGIQSYKDENCTIKSEVEKSNEPFSNMASIYAYMFARNQALVKAFTDIGIINKYTAGGAETDLYQNVNMLSSADTTTIFNYISGKKTYADLTDAQKGRITEVQFNALVGNCAPAVIFNLLAGNDSIVAKSTGANGEKTYRTYTEVLDVLFGSRVDLSEKVMNNGVALSLNVKVTDKVKIGLSVALTLKAGSAPTSNVTVPDGASGSANWLFISIPAPSAA